MKFWSILGWPVQSASEEVETEKVSVTMLPVKNGSRLELLEATSDQSAIAKFIAKRGPGIHHICLKVGNITEILAKLKASGVKLIHEKPIQGAGGCLVAFIHPSSTGGVLVELSQGEHK